MEEVRIPEINRVLSLTHETIDTFSTWCEDLEVHLNSTFTKFPNEKITSIMERLTNYKPNTVFPMINRLFYLLTETMMNVVKQEEITGKSDKKQYNYTIKERLLKLTSQSTRIRPIPSFDEASVQQYHRDTAVLMKVAEEHKKIYKDIQKQQEICWTATGKMSKYELCLATAKSSRSYLSNQLAEKELNARDKAIDQLQETLDSKVKRAAEASRKYNNLFEAESVVRSTMKQLESKIFGDITFGLTERLYSGLSSLKQILSTKSNQRTSMLLSNIKEVESHISRLVSSIFDTLSSKYQYCNPQSFNQQNGFNIRLPDVRIVKYKQQTHKPKTHEKKTQLENDNNNNDANCSFQSQKYLQRDSVQDVANSSACFINLSQGMVVKQKIAIESSDVAFGWARQKPWFQKQWGFFNIESLAV